MSPNGLILLISLSVAMADGPPPPPPPPSVDAAKAMDPNDPFMLIPLAAELSADAKRRDEQVAVLMTGLRSSGSKAEAAAALEKVLLQEEAQAAWESAYRELLASRLAQNERMLRVRYAESRSLSAHARGKAIADLGAMLQENPRDELVRNALGDAYLRNGRPDRALGIFEDGASSSQVWKGELAALISLGRYTDAMRKGGSSCPPSAARPPRPFPAPSACATWATPRPPTTSSPSPPPTPTAATQTGPTSTPRWRPTSRPTTRPPTRSGSGRRPSRSTAPSPATARSWPRPSSGVGAPTGQAHHHRHPGSALPEHQGRRDHQQDQHLPGLGLDPGAHRRGAFARRQAPGRGPGLGPPPHRLR